MRKIIYITLVITSNLLYAQNALVITGIIHGPNGGEPKAVEIYVQNDVPDLSTYALGVANNGGGTDGAEYPLSGSATAGQYIYVSSTNTSAFLAYFGFNPTFSTGFMNANGDDAFEIFYDATKAFAGAEILTDVFGVQNTGGVTLADMPWRNEKGIAYRKPATGPSTSFTQSDWSIQRNVLKTAGTTNATAEVRFPLASYAVPLPVTLLDLEGYEDNDGQHHAILKWSTVSEINNEKYEIYKSTNGIDFQIIEKIPGHASSNQKHQYIFNDKNFYQSAYYKIKQVDFDGNFNYFSTLFIKKNKQNLHETYLYPSLFDYNINLQSQFEKFNLKLVHPSGLIDVQNDISPSKIVEKLIHLPEGLYFIHLSNEHFSYEQKIIKK